MKTKNKSFKRLFAFLVALVMVTALVPSVIFAAEPTFPDVPASHWAYDYIEKLAKADIIGGYADGTFGPEDNVTRQQAAKMIAGAAKLKASAGFVSKFTDIDKATAEAQPHIKALEQYEVVGGFADGSFGPTLNIKRSQAAKMIVKAFDLEKGDIAVKFDDPVADAADQEYIDILASNGIIKGYTEDGKQLYKPYNLVTRAQLAKMIDKAMDWEVEVFSVQAITTVVNKAEDQQLEFAINGGKTAADVDALEAAGYTVTYLATDTNVDKDTGIVDASGAVSGFYYKVVLSHDDLDEDLESALQKVTIQDYSKIVTAITKVELADSTTKVVNESGKLVVGQKAQFSLEGTNKAGLKKQDLLTSDYTVAFASSNPSVAVVDSSGVVTAVSTGKVNITITANGKGFEVKEVVALEVVADARTAAKATFDVASIRLVSNNTLDVLVTVVDQYGDPMYNFSVDPAAVKTAAGLEILAAPTAATTNEDGEAELQFTAHASNVGKGTMQVKNGTVVIGSLPVEVGSDKEVASRKLEFSGDTYLNDDYKLDLYTGNPETVKDDNILELVWNKYNAANMLIGAETDYTTYTVASSKDSVAEVAVNAGVIKVTGKVVGTATITIKENTVTRASFVVTVVDTTPKAASIALAKDVTKLSLTASKTYKFTDIADKFVVLDQYGEKMTITDASVTFFTDDDTVLTPGTNDVKVIGEVGKTATLVVSINGKVLSVPVVVK